MTVEKREVCSWLEECTDLGVKTHAECLYVDYTVAGTGLHSLVCLYSHVKPG